MDMPEISRRRTLAYLAIAAVALVVVGHFLIASPGKLGAAAAAETAVPLEPVAATEPPVSTKALLVIHVVGAVRRPGLYRLEDGSRVDDAIQRAGGPSRKAALELINLAAPIVDGEQIVVPRVGPGGTQGVPATGATGTTTTGPIHLNSATLEQLDALPGVGPVTAQKIIDYRDRHGPFRSVDELDAIPGIGPARYEQLRDLVVP